MKNKKGSTESHLDPDDWAAFRNVAHELLDRCLDRIQHARDYPWQPPKDIAEMQGTDLPWEGTPIESVSEILVEQILPFATGNTHPTFFGWVNGTGTAGGVLAEMVAATMNSNCGARNHGAIYVERQVVNWLGELFGLPHGHGGFVASGTSMATLVALTAARVQLGPVEASKVSVYAVEGVHHCIAKALDVMGLAKDTLRLVPLRSAESGMDTQLLREMIETDKEEGVMPLAVIGTSGAVNTGQCDDLSAIASVCREHNIWFHVDGAFGAWLKLAPSFAHRVAGIDKVDSVACDFHKWLHVPYDAGLLLVRDKQTLLDAFQHKPDYLAETGDVIGLNGGRPWYTDQGIELSRGFRALKVWTTLKHYGLDALGRQVEKNCDQAQRMAQCVERSKWLDMANPVITNVCCFSVSDAGMQHLSANDRADVHTHVLNRLQLGGQGVLSMTRLHGDSVMRAAIVNHRTQNADVDAVISAIDGELASMMGE